MVIDELALSDEDIKKIIAGETSEMEEILTWLRHNTAMTLAALSSTSLLDRRREDDGTDTEEAELKDMMRRTEYETVDLEHIMRSSAKIAEAANPKSIENLVTQDSNLANNRPNFYIEFCTENSVRISNFKSYTLKFASKVRSKLPSSRNRLKLYSGIN